MSQHYSDPSRETETFACPDLEIFYRSNAAIRAESDDSCWRDSDGEPMPGGWYYWFCFPGCMPDSDPIGPFRSEDAALEDARDNV